MKTVLYGYSNIMFVTAMFFSAHAVPTDGHGNERGSFYVCMSLVYNPCM